MKCPFCGEIDNKVIDSRLSKDGSVIRRRRECIVCYIHKPEFLGSRRSGILPVYLDAAEQPYLYRRRAVMVLQHARSFDDLLE